MEGFFRVEKWVGEFIIEGSSEEKKESGSKKICGSWHIKKYGFHCLWLALRANLDKSAGF